MTSDTAPYADVQGLTVTYPHQQRPAVRGLSFRIAPGESYGLVGESGSGKTTAAMSLTRFLPPRTDIRADRLMVAGTDVLGLNTAELQRFRADALAVVYQEPGLALNPTMRVGRQVAEVYRIRGADRHAAWDAAVAALDRVRLPDPAETALRYPHELSGGQQQRVVIGMALAAEPRLLILDEPTTGLDSQVETEIMSLLGRLRAEAGFASLLISHNLPLVAAHCARLGVVKDGLLVEEGPADAIFTRPEHPYTRELVHSAPMRATARRAPHDRPDDSDGAAARAVLTVRHVRKQYGHHVVLDDLSFTIGRGETVGIVGASGSGKTTLGRAIAGLTRVDAGGIDVVGQPHGRPHRYPAVQMVFQNPDASLNPRRTVRQVLTRALALLHGTQTVEELAAATGLNGRLLDRVPSQLSGGQKQRVAIARAFAGAVPLIILDEPTSALDATTQKIILDLLERLQRRTGVAYLFISHDLAVVRYLAHRVGVLHGGTLVELDDTDRVFANPRHAYTRALLASALSLQGTPATVKR